MPWDSGRIGQSLNDAAACREIERGHGVRLGVGEELLVFVTRPTEGEEPRGVVEFSYAPLAVHATDCRVVIDRDRPSRRVMNCPEAGGEVLSFLFSVPGPANASVAVEVTAPAGDTTACPPELVARTPQVLLSGFELSASECRGTPDESGRYSILYPAPQPLAAGPWTLAVCTERGEGIEIDSAVVTSTALTPAGETPPPTAEGAAASPDGSAPALLTPGSHDPAFPCPTPPAEAAGG